MCEREKEGGRERDGGSGERERDDGRYVKRTCVRVSHQPVSQCVDVTLMQMACAGIHLSEKRRRKQTEDRESPLKEAEPSFECFTTFTPSLPGSPSTCLCLDYQALLLFSSSSLFCSALLKGPFKAAAGGSDFPARIQLNSTSSSPGN